MRYVSLILLVGLLGCSSGPRLVVVPPSGVPLDLTPVETSEARTPPDDLAVLMASEPGAVQAYATGKQVGSMLMYTYRLGQLYPIQTAVHQGTTILWPVGEQITAAPGAESMMVAGEGEEKVAAWSVEPRVSGTGAQERQGLVVTPRAANLKTTLTVFTSRHVYVLELTSHAKKYQPMVGFYAEPSAVAQKVSTQPTIQATGRLGVGYEPWVPEDQAPPSWTPLQTWDTTRLTIFRFPSGVWAREMPALYSLTTDGERQLVNYRQHGVYLLADRLADAWELKLGEVIVQVHQTPGYAVVNCPGVSGCPLVSAEARQASTAQ